MHASMGAFLDEVKNHVGLHSIFHLVACFLPDSWILSWFIKQTILLDLLWLEWFDLTDPNTKWAMVNWWWTSTQHETIACTDIYRIAYIQPFCSTTSILLYSFLITEMSSPIYHTNVLPLLIPSVNWTQFMKSFWMHIILSKWCQILMKFLHCLSAPKHMNLHYLSPWSFFFFFLHGLTENSQLDICFFVAITGHSWLAKMLIM